MPSTRGANIPSSLTGGQYSLLRAVLGLATAGAGAFALTLPAETLVFGPIRSAIGASMGVAGGLMLAIGLAPKTWGIVAMIGLIFVSGLILHPWLGLALVPLYVMGVFAVEGEPFGSWGARGRTDPDGGWKFPPSFYTYAAYIYCLILLLAAAVWFFGEEVQPWGAATGDSAAPWGWAGAGAATLLLFHLAAWLITSRTRSRSGWLTILTTGLLLQWLAAPLGLGLGGLLLLLFFVQPRWFRALGRRAEEDTLFFDGDCALCHGMVRFLVAEDRRAVFRFAPLEGETYQRAFSPPERARLPRQTVLVRRRNGQVLSHSDAALYALQRLGGWWWVLGTAGLAVPRAVRHGAYRLASATRFALFGRAKGACPMLPPKFRQRLQP